MMTWKSRSGISLLALLSVAGQNRDPQSNPGCLDVTQHNNHRGIDVEECWSVR
ncbi:MAG: hypothetical protein HXS53_08455 [Theionarchaea archaeon]|nr:hypothetical protein [Theionarchaea archaeon]